MVWLEHLGMPSARMRVIQSNLHRIARLVIVAPLLPPCGTRCLLLAYALSRLCNWQLALP